MEKDNYLAQASSSQESVLNPGLATYENWVSPNFPKFPQNSSDYGHFMHFGNHPSEREPLSWNANSVNNYVDGFMRESNAITPNPYSSELCMDKSRSSPLNNSNIQNYNIQNELHIPNPLESMGSSLMYNHAENLSHIGPFNNPLHAPYKYPLSTNSALNSNSLINSNNIENGNAYGTNVECMRSEVESNKNISDSYEHKTVADKKDEGHYHGSNNESSSTSANFLSTSKSSDSVVPSGESINTLFKVVKGEKNLLGSENLNSNNLSEYITSSENSSRNIKEMSSKLPPADKNNDHYNHEQNNDRNEYEDSNDHHEYEETDNQREYEQKSDNNSSNICDMKNIFSASNFIKESETNRQTDEEKRTFSEFCPVSETNSFGKETTSEGVSKTEDNSTINSEGDTYKNDSSLLNHMSNSSEVKVQASGNSPESPEYTEGEIVNKLKCSEIANDHYRKGGEEHVYEDLNEKEAPDNNKESVTTPQNENLEDETLDVNNTTSMSRQNSNKPKNLSTPNANYDANIDSDFEEKDCNPQMESLVEKPTDMSKSSNVNSDDDAINIDANNEGDGSNPQEESLNTKGITINTEDSDEKITDNENIKNNALANEELTEMGHSSSIDANDDTETDSNIDEADCNTKINNEIDESDPIPKSSSLLNVDNGSEIEHSLVSKENSNAKTLSSQDNTIGREIKIETVHEDNGKGNSLDVDDFSETYATEEEKIDFEINKEASSDVDQNGEINKEASSDVDQNDEINKEASSDVDQNDEINKEASSDVDDQNEDLATSNKSTIDNEGDYATDIIIKETFTINEEQMEEMEDYSLEEQKDLAEQVTDTEKATIGVKREASQLEESLEEDFESPPKKKRPRKSKCIFSLKNRRKKKKKSNDTFEGFADASISSSSSTTPQQRQYFDLPQFLQELSAIDRSLVVFRERVSPAGSKAKVTCVTLHETILEWALTDTLLGPFDSSKNLRSHLKVKKTCNFIFPEKGKVRNTSSIHPVSLGTAFPFSIPSFGGRGKEESPSGEEIKLPFPLEQLGILCPSSLGQRKKRKEEGGGESTSSTDILQTVTFAEEPLEWAFKETFLSSFDDSPILSDLLGLSSSSTKTWPDVTEEILAIDSVDYTFPFACPNSKRHYESLFFSDLNLHLPTSVLHETFQLPPLRSDLEKKLVGERDSLVKLLAVASFYKHTSCIPTVRTNRKLSVSQAALVSSFRPLIISQANSLALAIREAREFLLKETTCLDPTIIPALIRGPVQTKRSFLFSNVHRLEAAVVKDPNNKLQYF